MNLMNYFDNGMGGYSKDLERIAKQFGFEGANQLKDYLSKAEGKMQPYETEGRNAMGDYGRLSREMTNPNFVNTQMEDYEISPWAQNQMKQGQESINSAAYAGGFGGSTAQGRNLMNFSQDLSNKDMQQYFQNKMASRQGGMEGLANIYGKGFGAAGQMGQWNMDAGKSLVDILKEQASLKSGAAGAKAAGRAAKGNFISKGLSAIPGVGGFFK